MCGEGSGVEIGWGRVGFGCGGEWSGDRVGQGGDGWGGVWGWEWSGEGIGWGGDWVQWGVGGNKVGMGAC